MFATSEGGTILFKTTLVVITLELIDFAHFTVCTCYIAQKIDISVYSLLKIKFA